MDDLVAGLARRELPEDAVAITFDDGYVDNLRNALPVLEEEDLPATLFLTTGPTLSGRHYWWDELAAMILDARQPLRVRDEFGGLIWEFDFGQREPADQDRIGWRAWQEARTQRESAYYHCWERLRGLSPDVREEVMTRFRELLPTELDDADRPMTPTEVRELTTNSMFSLGGHTADHVDLLQVEPAAALIQIRTGKEQAEGMGGQRLTGFAYPHGRVDRRIEKLASEAGFEWACDTRHANINCRNFQPLRLPRIAAADQASLSFMT